MAYSIYRLLAETIERKKHAGIATFVMRGKEHLVAIFAENGILRAETLRFADQIRTPENIGLPNQRCKKGIAEGITRPPPDGNRQPCTNSYPSLNFETNFGTSRKKKNWPSGKIPGVFCR